MDLEDLIKKIGIKSSTKINEALDIYIKDSHNKARLEILLSEFLRITSDKSAHTFTQLASHKEIGSYYNYLDKNINNSDFDLAGVTQLTGNAQLYKIIGSDENTNSKFGLFSSTLINKNIKGGEKVQIITLIPLHFLFYKLKDAEAYVNIAGEYLGYKSKNSKIYADEVGGNAGYNMQNCELHVKKAGDVLVDGSKNSKIYAEEAGDFVGDSIDSCELHVKKAGDYIGYKSKNSRIYAEEAGDYAGSYMRDCELHVKKAGNFLGSGANNSKIYAEEAGINAGYNMKNSELFIYKLDGYLADSCFRRNNEVYLGKESYNKFIQNYPKYINTVKLWKKQKQNVDVFSGDYYGSK